MTPTAPPAATWSWPADVLTFAAKHGITPYLDQLLSVTQRLFPNRLLRVFVEEDPEIPDDCYLSFEVDITGMTVEELGATRRAWTDALYALCPFPLPGLFSLRRVEPL
jgi:hypothetical protein